jgi:hypothetical protein
MGRVQIATWIVDADAEATRTAYRQIARGGSEGCTCVRCLNFATSRPGCFPSDVIGILDAVGVDAAKEVEAVHYCRLAAGHHIYGVWFHFVGRFMSGEESTDSVSLDGITWLVRRKRDLIDVAFSSAEVLQLDLSLVVPWVLGGEEPS